MTWVKLRMPAGVATCGDICRRVAIGAGVMESVLAGLRGSSDSPAAGSGCLPGVPCWEVEAQTMGEASCSHFMVPVSCRLMAETMLLEGSAVSAGGVGLV